MRPIAMRAGKSGPAGAYPALSTAVEGSPAVPRLRAARRRRAGRRSIDGRISPPVAKRGAMRAGGWADATHGPPSRRPQASSAALFVDGRGAPSSVCPRPVEGRTPASRYCPRRDGRAPGKFTQVTRPLAPRGLVRLSRTSFGPERPADQAVRREAPMECAWRSSPGNSAESRGTTRSSPVVVRGRFRRRRPEIAESNFREPRRGGLGSRTSRAGGQARRANR